MLAVSKTVFRPKVTYDATGYRKARKEYERGDARKLIQMMLDASLDTHVQGCLIGRNAGYKRSFSIVSFDDTETDNRDRDWLAGVLQRLGVWDLLEEIHDARKYLFKVVDFRWEMIDGRDVPVGLRGFEQHHFRRDRETGILMIDHGNRLEAIPEDALVIEYHKTPLMLPVLRDYILKEFGLEAWSAFMENWAEPFILGRYPMGATPAFKEELEEGINDMAASSRGIAPQGSDVEIKESARGTGDHNLFEDRCNTGISIGLLGHANAVEDSGGINVGGIQTGYQVRFEVAVDDMRWVEPHVQEVIRRIWDRNIGNGRYPRFELNKQPQVDPRVHTDTVRQWFEMGLKIHPDEARKAGLYVYEDQEPLTKPDSPLGLLLD